MKGEGVPFAVTPEGSVADPATAPKRAYFYSCLDCGTHVRVRRGSKRAAHFAHYAETRGVVCSKESVLHKASKRLLAEHLAGFPDPLTIVQRCQGHESVDGGRVSCTNTAEVEVALPAYDQVTLEQVFGRQRLDVALLQAGAVVMGFEIYYAHEVSEATLGDTTVKPTRAIRNLFTYLADLNTYIKNHAGYIRNYGERYRNGERISTGFVESTINQAVSKRFCKKQQMRWTKRGAHLLLQTRTKVLNDELEDTFRAWYPQFRTVNIEMSRAA